MAWSYAVFKQDYYIATAEVLSGRNSDPIESADARGEIVAFSLKVRQNLARIARLDAEIGGNRSIVFPAALTAIQHESSTARLLDHEQLIFSARRRGLEESLKTLQLDRKLLEGRAASIEEQIRLAGIEIDAVEQEAAGVSSLLSKQLVPAPRLLDLHRSGAVIASRKVELESELLEIRQDIERASQEMRDIVNSREIKLLEERQSAIMELYQNETALASSVNVASTRDFGKRFDAGMLANEVDFIMSDALAYTVVISLGLYESITGGQSAELTEAASPEARISAAIERVQRNLLAERIDPGSKIEIAYRSNDPDEAARVANAIARLYIEGQVHTGGPVTQSAGPGEIHGGDASRGEIVRAARKPIDAAGLSDLTLLMGGIVLGALLGCSLGLVFELKARWSRRDDDVPANSALRLQPQPR